MLTAKSEIEDRVAGLEAGADDYLPKPFATNELIARIKALGRRSGNYSDTTREAGNLPQRQHDDNKGHNLIQLILSQRYQDHFRFVSGS